MKLKQLQSDLIFTHRAAERILNGETNYSVKDLYINHSRQEVAVMVARTSRLKLLSAEAFYADFTESRHSRSKSLRCQKISENKYKVESQTNEGEYQVTTSPISIACECQDYQNQIEAFGKGCCKHGYRVLSQLGYNRLEDYISSNSQESKATTTAIAR